jgi:Sap, sulfolipid-1-addressing protein
MQHTRTTPPAPAAWRRPHDLRAVYPALALIAGSGLLLRQQGIAALTIMVITLMVAWVPLVLAAVVPGASTRLLPWLGNWMNANNHWIQVVLGFGFGVWLLVKGVNGL